MGGRERVKLCSEFPVKKLVPCNLLEHDCRECIEGAEAVFDITPFEIKTFKLYFLTKL